jgi:hypothetical protein
MPTLEYWELILEKRSRSSSINKHVGRVYQVNDDQFIILDHCTDIGYFDLYLAFYKPVMQDGIVEDTFRPYGRGWTSESDMTWSEALQWAKECLEGDQ